MIVARKPQMPEISPRKRAVRAQQLRRSQTSLVGAGAPMIGREIFPQLGRQHNPHAGRSARRLVIEWAAQLSQQSSASYQSITRRGDRRTTTGGVAPAEAYCMQAIHRADGADPALAGAWPRP